MPFDAQVVQLSSEDLDKFFEASPTGSPNADNLTVGTEQQIVEKPAIEKVTKVSSAGIESLPFYNDDEEEPVEKVAEVEDTTKPKDAAIPDKPTEEVAPTDPVEENQNIESINEVLTNTVDFLVKSGKWVDFEGREGLEITQDVYADLVAKQDEYRVTQMFNELLDSTGDYGKAIIAHVKNGGNPDDIIDLFKEQKQLQQIDTTSEVGKQAVIEKYYSEVLGWKPEKVERTIKRLITDDEISTEFADVKEMYDQHYKEQLAKTEEKVKLQEQENLQRQQLFVENIKTVLKEDNTLTESDRKLISSSVFDFKHKLPNGQKVNDFYIKFAELQANPKEYVEFVRYVMDKENYKNSIRRTEKTEANKNAFSFIKGGAALSKTKSTPIEINKNPTKQQRGTDFSFALKQK